MAPCLGRRFGRCWGGFKGLWVGEMELVLRARDMGDDPELVQLPDGPLSFFPRDIINEFGAEEPCEYRLISSTSPCSFASGTPTPTQTGFSTGS